MAKKKPKKRAVTYRLPEVLLDRLDELAEQNRRTVTAEVEIAIEAHLKRNKMLPPADPKGE